MPVLLKCSNVAFLDTNQAPGHESRNKPHLCICPIDGRFYYMNTKIGDRYPDLCIQVTREDWPQMPNLISYINTDYLSLHRKWEYENKNHCGSCTEAFMKRLYTFIEDSGTISPKDKTEVLGYLKSYKSQ